MIEDRPSTDLAAVRDRAVGAFVGLFVGDALGSTLEFTRRDSQPPLADMIGGGPFGLKPGQFTDDGSMAGCLGDSLLACGELNEREVMDRFVRWWREGEWSVTGHAFDIGITVREALARYEETGVPIAGSTDPMTAGNGSLMRLAPVIVRYWNDDARLNDAARRSSIVTHCAQEAVEACEAFGLMIARAIAGKPLSDVLSATEGTYTPTVQAIVEGSWRGKEREAIQSSGYVLHSLEAALWSVGTTGSFEEAVLKAANLGEDADTTAAITGQLAGAIYGLSGISDRWVEKLAWRDRIERLGNDLFEASLR